MSKYYYYILFLFVCFPSFAQTVTVRGKIMDKTNKIPLESATVYISSAKDSTIIDYTISDKNGLFSLKTSKIKQPVFLKISFIGYQDYKQQIADLLTDKDVGTIDVEENPNDLKEVVITNEAPPVRIKQDTLEFNASSFKVRQDSNVEALLRQLPGVSIDKDGKITVNGKEVNNILVNGKPFFGKDGKIATENLPSNIIDKVQISDTKTKEEELAGQAASSDNKTINLTIQKDMNKGLFGKFSGGGGSDGRYESSGLINYFKDKQKISFLGSSNNINSVGFSMDEIFDSMGGGRNLYTSGDGSFNIDGQQFGGGSGITQSNMIGLNYADQIGKYVEPSGSYFYTSTENNNANRSKIQLLPNNTITTAENISRTVSNAHNLSMEVEAKIDTMTTLNIRPNYKKNSSHFTSTNSANTVAADTGVLENDTKAYSNSDSETTALDNTIYLFRRFRKRGRNLSLNLSNQNNNDESERLTVSTTNFYREGTVENRNQVENNRNTSDNYSGSITYNEPITDSVSVGLGGKVEYKKQIFNKQTYGFDDANESYTNQIAEQSNFITSKTNTVNPFASLNIKKKKFNARIGLGTQVSKFNNYSLYLGEETRLEKNYFFPTVNGHFSYRSSKSKSLYVNYNYSATMPSPNQVLDVVNLANPLNTITGNPDLDPVRSHRVYLGFNNYDYATKSGFYLYSGGSFYEKQIVTSTAYLASAAQATTFRNISNTYDGYLGMNYSKSIKKEQNTYKFDLGIDANVGLDKGFYSTLPNQTTPPEEDPELSPSILYESRSFSLSPKIELSWEYGEIFTISPSYTYNYNKTTFKNFLSDGATYYVHNFKLQTTSYWPKHFVFGNDFGYTYNSNIADGFRKDFYLWNASLGYNFYNNKLLAKVKVYDLLDQNVNATRTVTPTSIQDMENTVLKRYVMFSVTYTIEKFGGKKKNEWD